MRWTRALVLALSFGAFAWTGCGRKVDEPAKADFVPGPGTPGDPGPATLQIEDIVIGKGPAVGSGNTVTVRYTGRLMNGRVFDQSSDHKIPFEFRVGYGNVIRGWDEGMMGMREGGRRRLTIPAALAYGDAGQPGIPPNSGLVFDLELLEVAVNKDPAPIKRLK